MKYKELKFKIGETIFEEWTETRSDGVEFLLKFPTITKKGKLHICSVLCPIDDVEVIVDGE